jgi:nitrate/TMAO reductase-like tetraheme cytochrome c subunit
MNTAALIWNPGLFRITLATLTLALLLIAVPASTEQAASGEGAAACLRCHENETVIGMLKTPHADFENPRAPAAREQCESCHGPSAKHMEFPMQVGNIVFTKHGKTPVPERNKMCLACHHEGEQAQWGEGEHGESLSCASCHQMHAPKDPTLNTVNQARDCGTCHEEVLPTAPTASSHPLTGEKAMYCTQCHNPHGRTDLTSCIECHEQDAAALAKQTEKVRGYHQRALSEKIDCTSCHKGFVHSMPLLTLSEVPESQETAEAAVHHP